MSHTSERRLPYPAAGSNRAPALKTVLAGAVAVWIMDRFDWFVFNHEDKGARKRTEQVKPGGMDPAHALAAKAAHALSKQLDPAAPHQHPAGLAVHYAVPVGLAWFIPGTSASLAFSENWRRHFVWGCHISTAGPASQSRTGAGSTPPPISLATECT
jgi:hypothetical protein